MPGRNMSASPQALWAWHSRSGTIETYGAQSLRAEFRANLDTADKRERRWQTAPTGGSFFKKASV
jgi:hypothetical protein